MPEITSGEITNVVMSEKAFFNLEVANIINEKEKLEQEMQKIEEMESEQSETMNGKKINDDKTLIIFNIGGCLDSIERLRATLKVKRTKNGGKGEEAEKIDKALEVSEIEKKAKEYLKKQTAEFEKNGF